ncbi:unnamed protein product [Rotaria sordida]|uniref:Protein phosphatase n=1 Tax=Rotaria sordida TaxID=392033 RepID=A0A815A3N1_9BILA|nr:unnamed protein product [Rotaria sordida]
MARIKSLISPKFSQFANDYDVYVDYGKGRPIKMNNNEATFIDVEQFLIDQNRLSKLINNKKPNEVLATNVTNRNKTSIRNSNIYDSTKNNGKLSTHKIGHYSNFRKYSEEKTNHNYSSVPTLNHLYQNSSSVRIEPTIIYDETWLSNKQYNKRVAAFIDHINTKFTNKNTEISNERKLSTYKVSTGQIIHKGIYPAKIEKHLCLRIAVNGASKSLRGQLPLSNLNLNNGDFGDDAGMIVENRNFCFVGLADGAGGNRSYGINPADFSRAILAACEKILHRNNFKPNQLPRLIKSAMQQVEASEVQGSSTLCLLALDKQEHTLTSLNIGDSGFVIYRNNEIYCRSTCTMSSNGCGPRQLFVLNDSIGLSYSMHETKFLQDCSLDNIKVRKGDIIILSSDGLWDVIESDQLQKVVERNKNKHLQNLADDLLKRAVDGYIIDGRDDILIIVCRVDEL